MLQLRRASKNDLEFLIKLDLEHEGFTPSVNDTAVDLEEHRAKISRYVHDADKAAWVFEDPEAHEQVAGILCWFRDLKAESESEPSWQFFDSIRQSLPRDGKFCEVFNLWVAPDFRRQGLASKLKQQLEIESRHRGIKMRYIQKLWMRQKKSVSYSITTNPRSLRRGRKDTLDETIYRLRS